MWGTWLHGFIATPDVGYLAGWVYCLSKGPHISSLLVIGSSSDRIYYCGAESNQLLSSRCGLYLCMLRNK